MELWCLSDEFWGLAVGPEENSTLDTGELSPRVLAVSHRERGYA